MNKLKFGDKEYAYVPDRIKQFREDNPRGSIETEPTYNADGSITFKATIIRDMSDPDSARATGNARYTANELTKPKQFEKLETVATGRALAMLGYLNDGQVATTEEMEEFNEFRHEKVQEQIEQAETVEELVEIFNSLNALQKQDFVPQLTEKKKQLMEVKDGAKV